MVRKEKVFFTVTPEFDSQESNSQHVRFLPGAADHQILFEVFLLLFVSREM